MTVATGGERAARERDGVCYRSSRGVIVVETARAIDHDIGQIAVRSRSQSAIVGDLQIATVDGEISGESGIEGGVSSGGEDHLARARLGHIFFALQAAGEGQRAGGISDVPSLIGSQLERCRNGHQRRASGGDFNAIRGQLWSDLQAVGQDCAWIDGNGGRRVGRNGRRFKGQGVDLEVLLQRGNHRARCRSI